MSSTASEREQSAPTTARVLNVITKLDIGGAQETVLSQCELLDRDRFSVALVVGRHLGAGAELTNEAQTRGISVISVPTMVRPIRPFKDLAAVFQLTRLFLTDRPDVVHTHSSKAGVLGRIAARLARVPQVVHTVHGWSFHEGMSAPGRFAYVSIERLAARLSSAIVVVSEHDREIGVGARIGRPEQYELIRPGIDLTAYGGGSCARSSARVALGLSDDACVIGTVGRLAEPKDPLTLIDAAAAVVKAVPQLHVVLIGDGPLHDHVERTATERGIRERVHLVGERRDIASILPAFDVFVFSSRREALGRSFVEALATGVPVVATNVGGVGEVLTDGESGLLVEAGNPGALAEAITRVVTDDVLAERLRNHGCAAVREFGADRMVERLMALYDRLLAPAR